MDQVEYKIGEIKEPYLFVQPIPDSAVDEAEWDISFSLNMPQADQLEVGMHIMYRHRTLLDEDGVPEHYLNTAVIHVVETRNLPFDRMLGLDNLTDEQVDFFATMLGVAIGTTRGIVFARTSHLLGRQHFMPVLLPMEIMQDMIAQAGEEAG